MPPLCEYDPRPAILRWMDDKDRRTLSVFIDDKDRRTLSVFIIHPSQWMRWMDDKVVGFKKGVEEWFKKLFSNQDAENVQMKPIRRKF